MHLVTGIQVLVLQWPVNQLQSLLSKVQEPLRNTHCLRPSFTDEGAIVEVHVSSRELQDNAEANCKFRNTGEGKMNNLTLPVSPICQNGTS